MRFQFIFNNKDVKVTTILFKNLTPILDIEKLVYFKETGLSGNWLKKEFRYSFDNVIWSNWSTFTQQALTNIQFKNNSNFYLEALYTRQSYNIASIEDLYLFYDAIIATPVDPVTDIYPYDNLNIYNVPDTSGGVSVYDASARVDSVNGVSLTVVNSQEDKFSVAIIPFTYDVTNFHQIKKGTVVNLEFDIIGKYIQKILMTQLDYWKKQV